MEQFYTSPKVRWNSFTFDMVTDRMVVYQGFPTRMVYLYYISCLRYTILVGNPRFIILTGDRRVLHLIWWKVGQVYISPGEEWNSCTSYLMTDGKVVYLTYVWMRWLHISFSDKAGDFVSHPTCTKQDNIPAVVGLLKPYLFCCVAWHNQR